MARTNKPGTPTKLPTNTPKTPTALAPVLDPRVGGVFDLPVPLGDLTVRERPCVVLAVASFKGRGKERMLVLPFVETTDVFAGDDGFRLVSRSLLAQVLFAWRDSPEFEARIARAKAAVDAGRWVVVPSPRSFIMLPDELTVIDAIDPTKQSRTRLPLPELAALCHPSGPLWRYWCSRTASHVHSLNASGSATTAIGVGAILWLPHPFIPMSEATGDPPTPAAPASPAATNDTSPSGKTNTGHPPQCRTACDKTTPTSNNHIKAPPNLQTLKAHPHLVVASTRSAFITLRMTHATAALRDMFPPCIPVLIDSVAAQWPHTAPTMMTMMTMTGQQSSSSVPSTTPTTATTATTTATTTTTTTTTTEQKYDTTPTAVSSAASSPSSSPKPAVSLSSSVPSFLSMSTAVSFTVATEKSPRPLLALLRAWLEWSDPYTAGDANYMPLPTHLPLRGTAVAIQRPAATTSSTSSGTVLHSWSLARCDRVHIFPIDTTHSSSSSTERYYDSRPQGNILTPPSMAANATSSTTSSTTSTTTSTSNSSCTTRIPIVGPQDLFDRFLQTWLWAIDAPIVSLPRLSADMAQAVRQEGWDRVESELCSNLKARDDIQPDELEDDPSYSFAVAADWGEQYYDSNDDWCAERPLEPTVGEPDGLSTGTSLPMEPPRANRPPPIQIPTRGLIYD